MAGNLVSIEKAARDYGVVINRDTMEVDEAATNERREQIRSSRPPITTFTLGPTPEPIGIVKKVVEQQPTRELKMGQAAD